MIPLFDCHCDTLLRCWWKDSPYYNGGSFRQNPGHLDLLRAKAHFAPYCQIFAIWGEATKENGLTYEGIFQQQYRIFCREMEVNQDLIVHCRTASEIRQAAENGKIAALLAVEGAELLGCKLERLTDAYQKGVRAVNLTWNFENALSGSNDQGMHLGLTAQGRAFVSKMLELGMLVDVSHLSDPGFWDTAELAESAGKPLIAGHSNSRRICSHKRNLTDEQFTAIIKLRGIAGLNLCGEFLGECPTLDTLVAHIEHWMSLGGQQNVAIGGDWDGCDLFPGMEDITGLEQLYERLLRLNYPEELVRSIFYHNIMRVVNDVCTI